MCVCVCVLYRCDVIFNDDRGIYIHNMPMRCESDGTIKKGGEVILYMVWRRAFFLMVCMHGKGMKEKQDTHTHTQKASGTKTASFLFDMALVVWSSKKDTKRFFFVLEVCKNTHTPTHTQHEFNLKEIVAGPSHMLKK